MLDEVDQLRATLRALLPGNLPAYYERPPRGTWSPAEILRHLLFAEQIHLARELPRDAGWSAVGLGEYLVSREARAARMVGSPQATVPELLATWDRAHAHVRSHISGDTPGLRAAVFRNLRHLRTHTREVERLLRKVGE